MESKTFKNKLEQFRTHYKNTYGIEMDDETLYFFIRVNEMQVALSKQISEMPKVKFKKGMDYFWYGLGTSITYFLFIILICFVVLLALIL